MALSPSCCCDCPSLDWLFFGSPPFALLSCGPRPWPAPLPGPSPSPGPPAPRPVPSVVLAAPPLFALLPPLPPGIKLPDVPVPPNQVVPPPVESPMVPVPVPSFDSKDDGGCTVGLGEDCGTTGGEIGINSGLMVNTPLTKLM